MHAGLTIPTSKRKESRAVRTEGELARLFTLTKQRSGKWRRGDERGAAKRAGKSGALQARVWPVTASQTITKL